MPIHFMCPHCGTTTNVADMYAGQTGPCAKCGQTITIPPAGGGFVSSPRPSSKRNAILVVLGVVLVVVLLLPLMQAAPEEARRIQCCNNMKQIALAMHNYVSANKCFPPAYVADKNGKPLYSWRVLLLPYMEGETLSKAYHFDEPWDSPNNRKITETAIKVFRCPYSSHPAGDCTTDYMIVVGPHTISDGPHSRKISEITDGLSNTIMIVEVADSGVNWAEPKDLQFDQIDFKINGQKKPGIGSHHPNGCCHVAICDGSVRYMPNSTAPEKIKALLTIDGGEKVDLGD